jgi:hypothetical protein
MRVVRRDSAAPLGSVSQAPKSVLTDAHALDRLFGAAAPTDCAMTTPEPTHLSLVVSRMTLTRQF